MYINTNCLIAIAIICGALIIISIIIALSKRTQSAKHLEETKMIFDAYIYSVQAVELGHKEVSTMAPQLHVIQTTSRDAITAQDLVGLVKKKK